MKNKGFLVIIISFNCLLLFADGKSLSLPNDQFLVDTTVFYAPNAFSWPTIQGSIVASDGENYFVTWQDWRDGQKIYGARVSQSGEILDPAAIPISLSTGDNKQGGTIAFGDSNYLVVWRQPESLYPTNWDLYGTRVSRTGIVLDTIPIAISTVPRSDQNVGEIAFDGTNYLVVWEDCRTPDREIYGARVNLDGVVIDSNGICISGEPTGQVFPDIAFDGTNFLVVWLDGRNSPLSSIYGTRVNQSGMVIDTGIAISIYDDEQHYHVYPAVAYDGCNYIIVWCFEDRRVPSYQFTDIYGACVNPSGVVIDSFPVSTQPKLQYLPALACGVANQTLITYSGWTDYINSHPANTIRIWGKFYPGVGIEERLIFNAERSMLQVYPNPAKTVIRVLIPWASFTPNASRLTLKIFDVSGKLVKEIASPAPLSKRQFRNNYATSSKKVLGRNDRKIEISLKGINPGIYFLQLGTVESTLGREDPTRETKKFLVIK